MISIYRSSGYDCPINKFYGRDCVNIKEVKIVDREIFGKKYKHAEPVEVGCWAFGGTFLFTSNGIYPEFNDPIALHDRDMTKE